jgi:hypothetical protein
VTESCGHLVRLQDHFEWGYIPNTETGEARSRDPEIQKDHRHQNRKDIHPSRDGFDHFRNRSECRIPDFANNDRVVDKERD